MAKTKKFVVRDLARKELRLRTYALNDGAKPEVVTEEIKVVEPSYKFEDGILISDVRVCDLITVKSCIYKIPEDESTAEVELIRENARGKTTFRLPLSVVGDTRKLGEVLANHHILLKQSNQYVMSDYFRASIDYADKIGQIKYEHSPIGLYDIDGKTVFLGEKTQIKNNIYSTCTRDFGKFRAGSEEAYNEMLDKVVFPSVKLSLAYILGFTGVVSAKLYDKTNVIVPIFGFNNTTSTGKTTAVMLSVSPFSDPSLENGSLMIKTDSSQNGQNAQMGNIKGLPFVFDDINTDTRRDISSTLYRLSSGMPRIVSSVKGEVLKRGSWRGTVLITSETSLLDQITKSGIFARYCEFKNIVWTDTAEIADYIKEVVSSNFGWKGWKFGEHVANIDTDLLLKKFKECKEEILKMIKQKDALSSRISSKYAIILLTAKLMNEFFNIQLKIDEIMKFIVEVEAQNLKDRNRVHTSYEYLYDFFNSHRKNFNITFSDNKESMAFGTCFGDAVFRKGEELYLKIKLSVLDEIMKNGGFSQYKNYLPEWKKNGYIHGDTGRNTTTSKKLGRHYKFIYRIEDIFDDADSEKNQTPPICQVKYDDTELINELSDDESTTSVGGVNEKQ